MTVLLAACVNKPSVYSQAWPPGATTGVVVGGFTGAATGAAIGGTSAIPLGAVLGAILGGGIGALTDKTPATQQLEDAGIQVIQLGDIVEVILPADLIFEPNGTTVLRSAEPILDQVVDILNRFCQINIKVVGHSDVVGTNQQQVLQSKLQAQSVVAYLWSRGIPLDRMTFIGMGRHDDVATFNSVYGNGYNRRIEILFWRTVNSSARCAPPKNTQGPFIAQQPMGYG